MTKKEALNNLQKAWQELLSVVGKIPLDTINTPDVTGNWSVKDLLGHIADWNEQVVLLVDAMSRGEKKAAERYSNYGNIDEWNERAVEKKRPIPIPLILVHLGVMHQRVVSLLEQLPDSVLENEQIARAVRVDTWEHYREHAPDIERWVVLQG
jgi:hypothetical protein